MARRQRKKEKYPNGNVSCANDRFHPPLPLPAPFHSVPVFTTLFRLVFCCMHVCTTCTRHTARLLTNLTQIPTSTHGPPDIPFPLSRIPHYYPVRSFLPTPPPLPHGATTSPIARALFYRRSPCRPFPRAVGVIVIACAHIPALRPY
jgi:hypothetical protein